MSSIGWRRGMGRGGAFLLISPLLGPLPTRSSQGEDAEFDAALVHPSSDSNNVVFMETRLKLLMRK
jgi:hypothetical protein